MLMVLCVLALSAGTGTIDQLVAGAWLENVPWISSAHSEDMRAVLSTVAGSMITVAGVTFSMTILSVSFASAQFGPRLVANFMRDRGNQVTLGTFIATFVYCLMVLGMVETSTVMAGGGEGALPRVSFLAALLLTLGSIAVLIYFIHHVPETINVSNITAGVGEALRVAMTDLFPAPPDKGDDPGRPDPRGAAEAEATASFGDGTETAPVAAGTVGYVQAIDQESLIEVARRLDLVVRLEIRPGSFVSTDTPLLHATPAARVDAACRSELRHCFAVGRSRTATQDAVFLVDELVEIIGRALSPGVCDPFTAINCIDWLETALGISIHRTAPVAVRRDGGDEGGGTIRVIAHPVTFRTVADAAFGKSLQYVATDRNAAIHMMRMISEIGMRTDDAGRRGILARHAANLVAAGEESLTLGLHRAELRSRYERVCALLASAPKDYGRRDADGWLAWDAGVNA